MRTIVVAVARATALPNSRASRKGHPIAVPDRLFLRMTTEIPGTVGYGANASALAAQYESITFEQVHRELIHLLPAPPTTVLDIGAGSGRDAAALARRGYRVVAVEPTDELRGEGQRLHGALPIEWIDDHLPTLQVLRNGGRRFELAMLTAVWMHLDLAERDAAMEAVAELVLDGGQVFMSLRHGPIPRGRRMFDVSADETKKLAAEHGLQCRHHGTREDMLDRSDVSWCFLALQKRLSDPLPHHDGDGRS